MHQTRNEASVRLPILRKGTKYIASGKGNPDNSVSVLIAVRDILKLANTAKEVKEMIKQKKLKVNNRIVRNDKEEVHLFNILEADKPYRLSILPTNKFAFESVSLKDGKLCKVVNKHLFKGNRIQLNLNDGTNLLSKEKISVGDSLYIDFSGKILKHIPIEKGKKALVFKGKYSGNKVSIESVEDKKASIKLENGSTTILNKDSLMVL